MLITLILVKEVAVFQIEIIKEENCRVFLGKNDLSHAMNKLVLTLSCLKGLFSFLLDSANPMS